MTAKKYNKMHRVLDLDARDARSASRGVGGTLGDQGG